MPMDAPLIFHPPVRRGLAIHGGLIVFLIFISIGGLWQATEVQLGPVILLYLVLAIIALGVLPFLVYRAYALWRASYILTRGGVQLRWGLREEDIPVTAIVWMRPVELTGMDFPRPWSYLPGAMIGVRQLPDGGQIEYLAAGPENLVLIATANKIFAISPAAPKVFLSSYQRFAESASEGSFAARSAYPAFLINRVWASRLARYLLLGGLSLALTLFVAVILIVPGREKIYLGYRPGEGLKEGLPAVQLFLLPVFNGLFYLADVLFGMFFYRRQNEQILAYLLWGASLLSGLLFWVALLFILAV